MIKNSNGDTWLGVVTGDVRVNAANGDIVVDRAGAGVVAKTANGDIRLGEVDARHRLAETAYGEIEVGIRAGTAAWLDAPHPVRPRRATSSTTAEPPATGDDAVEVRARTAYGDIVIRRAAVREPLSPTETTP